MLSSCKYYCAAIPQRWVLVVMTSIGYTISCIIRNFLSITITEMVFNNNLTAENNNLTGTEIACKNITFGSCSVYDWNEYIQGIILSAFYWGFLPGQILHGSLSERYGSKYFFGCSILLPSIFTFFTPIALNLTDYRAIFALRVVVGFFSGASIPCIHNLISEWAAPAERARFGSIITSSFLLGTIFGMVVSPQIIIHTGLGWPGAFYVFGIVGIVWFPLWVLLCYNKPEDHPFISKSELNFLQDSLKYEKHKNLPPASWKHILKSKPFWALFAALIGANWTACTITSELPKYLKSVVGFSIEYNGYFSSLSYLCTWLSSITSSWLSDRLLAKEVMTLTNMKKLLSVLSLFGSTSFVMCASFAERNQVAVVVLFILSSIMIGPIFCSILVNAMDLSPNYAGTLMSFGNGVATYAGILSPFVTGVLTPNNTVYEWRHVFWIMMAVNLIASFIYLKYGSGKIQAWNDPEFVKRDGEKNENYKRKAIIV